MNGHYKVKFKLTYPKEMFLRRRYGYKNESKMGINRIKIMGSKTFTTSLLMQKEIKEM